MLSFSALFSNNLFLQEVQSKREAKNNKNILNFYYAANTAYTANLMSLQVNPFYKLSFPFNNFAARLNYINYNEGDFYANQNYELVFVYNFINYELLTLYINYAIYSMYNLRFYDFEKDKEVRSAKYGNSFSLGFDARIYNSLYLTIEKRWVQVQENYIKNLDSFYLGLKYKISLKMLKES